MKGSRALSVFAFVLLALAPCFAHHMAVVVNKSNNVADISAAQLSKLFLLETKKWSDGRDVVLVIHRDSSGELLTLQRLGKMSSSEWRAFVTSHKGSFNLVDSDEELLHAVETTPGAIGLVEVHSITDQVDVLRVSGKLPMEAGYLPH